MNTHVIMIGFLLSVSVAVAGFASEPQNEFASVKGANRPHRSLSAIQVDVHTALRAEASSRRAGANVPEVVRLIHLYRELAAHPKRDKSEFLTRLALRVRSRLENARDHIERQNARTERRAKNREVPHTIAAPETHVLAQQFVVPGGAAQAQGPQPAAAQPGGAESIDYGPELVDLIQRTISPATWDINGGNGSVVYFAPRHAIVVSAPADVHDQVGDVLGQLRAAP